MGHRGTHSDVERYEHSSLVAERKADNEGRAENIGDEVDCSND